MHAFLVRIDFVELVCPQPNHAGWQKEQGCPIPLDRLDMLLPYEIINLIKCKGHNGAREALCILSIIITPIPVPWSGSRAYSLLVH